MTGINVLDCHAPPAGTADAFFAPPIGWPARPGAGGHRPWAEDRRIPRPGQPIPGGTTMDECCQGPVQVGTAVPDFEMETYDPKTGDFGKVSLAEQKKSKRWT